MQFSSNGIIYPAKGEHSTQKGGDLFPLAHTQCRGLDRILFLADTFFIAISPERFDYDRLDSSP